jgi:hypothetical protein
MKIGYLKNIEKDKSIFILGNAPSIKQHDLTKLNKCISIGMNGNPILEKEFDFISKYYVVSDNRFMSHPDKGNIATKLVDKNTYRILREELKEFDDNDLDDRTAYITSIGKNGYSFNLEYGYYFGCTTTMLAIQLASYIGAKNIFICGVNLKYDKKNARFYSEEKTQEFDAFTGVQIHNIHNAYKELKKNGINLYNTEKDSFIDPYVPYIDFNEAVQMATNEK